ncbi:hypothetical protein OCAR_5553 [Afipia carboxidovorans OM5]|uniref:hypothetical protein n=1 Tax=Afipia carboxidovorans TaxID=40137 RepID=UPI0001737186|nr:hypothetical protein [Afipia carboxidovorans]ACI92684.1 hypothetical protein OCAR_5553 [Afipia carboxidovorans OM5]BEV44720.1 hypothetical protein CRBSH125_09030 [Afipia carboxidovorans]
MAKKAMTAAARRKKTRNSAKSSNPPTFNRLDPVRLVATGEVGTVTGAAQYDVPAATEYLVRFPDGSSTWVKCRDLTAA